MTRRSSFARTEDGMTLPSPWFYEHDLDFIVELTSVPNCLGCTARKLNERDRDS